MKKLLLLGLALVLFTACQKQRYFSESPEIDSFKANISSYNNGDWEAWETRFADTAKLYVNSLKSMTAKDLENAQKELLSNFSSYGFQDKDSFVEMVIDSTDETWVNYWANWHGKLKANDKEIDVPVHITAQFVNGKIVEVYDYYDSGIVKTALDEIEKANNMPVVEKAMVDAMGKVVDGWNAHDISNLKSVSIEKLIRTANGTIIANNIDEYEKFMNTFVTAFPNFAVKVDKYDIKGNKAYVYWTVTGTNNGEFMGNAPTGKKIVTHGFSVWSMNEDGKFTREDAFHDQLNLYNQLGLSPPKS